MNCYKYTDKQDSKHSFELNGEFLNAINVKLNCVLPEYNYRKSEKAIDTSEQDKIEHEFKSYVKAFSEIPEFIEPKIDKFNATKQKTMLSKILYIIHLFECKFNFNQIKFVSQAQFDLMSETEKIQVNLYEKIEDRRRIEERKESICVPTLFIGEQVIDTGVTVGEFSTCDRLLMKQFSHKVIETYKQKMIEMNLIEPVKDEHGIESYIVDKKAKRYFWYKNNIKQFKDYCKANQIERFKPLTQYERYLEDKTDNEMFLPNDLLNEVRIGSVHIPVINNNTTLTERMIVNSCFEKYPQLIEFAKDEKDNVQQYYSDKADIRPKSNINIEWNEDKTYVRKVKFRQTNSSCNATKNDYATDIKRRKDVRNKYNCFSEYDVKSSVPRMTVLLNTGRWINQTTDLYEPIFVEYKRLNPNCVYEWNNATRTLVKDATLSNGFDSIEYCGRNICNKLCLPAKVDMRHLISESAKLYHQAVQNTIGEMSGEIFLMESFIYQKVRMFLNDNGYSIYQVYDGFYADNELPDNDTMNAIIEQYAMDYYNRFIKVNKPQAIDVSAEQISEIVEAVENGCKDECDENKKIDVEQVIESYGNLKAENPAMQQFATDINNDTDNIENKSVSELRQMIKIKADRMFTLDFDNPEFVFIEKQINRLNEIINRKQNNY